MHRVQRMTCQKIAPLNQEGPVLAFLGKELEYLLQT
jgi:hypothetical protein